MTDTLDQAAQPTDTTPENTALSRAPNGRWLPGKTPNPGGRPKEFSELKELAREYTTEAVVRLVHWMRSADPVASIAATRELLSRGYGKPEQSVSLPNGGSLVNISISGSGQVVGEADAAAAWRRMTANVRQRVVFEDVPSTPAQPALEAAAEEPPEDPRVAPLSGGIETWEKLGQ